MNTEELSKKLSIRKQPWETDKKFAIRVQWHYEKWKRQNLLDDDD